MNSASNITQNDFQERVALLKKFRSLLEDQRKKFQQYLTTLEKQAEAITQDNVDAVVAHTELEQSIVTEIASIQKVIVPFELMYKQTHPDALESEIPRLQTDLDQLKIRVLEQNKVNRELLKTHMIEVRQQIKELKNPYTKKTSVYASDKHTGSVIDVQL